MAVTICIEESGTRCEVYVNAKHKAVVTIGPAHGEDLITQAIEMNAEDLTAFIKICRGVLKQLNESNNR